jgi:hypothetical protein
MSDVDFQIVDVERELEKRRNARGDPNIAGTSKKSLGCGGLILRLIIGIVIFRLIIEIIADIFG